MSESKFTPVSNVPAETRNTIADWANQTFGHATDKARIARALEEVAELSNDIGHAPQDAFEELADVVICLCASPSTAGLDVPALVGPLAWQAVEAKMVINRKRRWVLRGDGNGDHVKGA